MGGVPSAESLLARKALAPFLVQPAEVTGVYENSDVDAVVFHYASSTESEHRFWQEIRREAGAQAWVERSPGPGYSAFERRTEFAQGRWGLEVVRIHFSPSRVAVGIVQTDHCGDSSSVSGTAETRYAAERIWPRFEALMEAPAAP